MENKYKKELLDKLAVRRCEDIQDLWGCTKNIYKESPIEMGGSYASIGGDISVILKIPRQKKLVKFNVSKDEVNVLFIENNVKAFLEHGEHLLACFKQMKDVVVADPDNDAYANYFNDSEIGLDMLKMRKKIKEELYG